MNNTANDTIIPWYKQFWPWFLILLPLSVVIASVATFWVAQNNQPSLVSGNYYKQGLAINSNLQLQEKANQLGLSSKLSLGATTLTVQLNGLHNDPQALVVELRHPTISQHDRSLQLTNIAPNVYQAPFTLPKSGKWYLSISDTNTTWTIKQVLMLDVATIKQ
ncbi:MAG: FixH family protein [Cycloclasticus sp.]|nr:FixH family protein [Cycloclasticus sp.]